MIPIGYPHEVLASRIAGPPLHKPEIAHRWRINRTLPGDPGLLDGLLRDCSLGIHVSYLHVYPQQRAIGGFRWPQTAAEPYSGDVPATDDLHRKRPASPRKGTPLMQAVIIVYLRGGCVDWI